MKFVKTFLSDSGAPEDNERKKFIIVTVLLLGLFVGLYLVQRVQELRRKAQEAGVDLSLVPSVTSVLPGEKFSVDIVVNTNGLSLSATELHVSFDSAFLEAESIIAKDYLPVVLPPGPEVAPGRASIILGSLPTEPKTGTGTLATINFLATAASANPVDIMFATGTQTAAVGFTSDVTRNLTPTTVTIGAVDEPLIRLAPASDVKALNTIFPVDINFTTGAGGKKISSVTARLTYDFTGGSPELDVVDASGNVASKISQSTILDSGDWDFPVNSVSRSAGKVTIDLAAVNTSTSGFASSSETTLATIYFKGTSAPASNPVEVTFSTTDTKMLTKEDPPVNILTKMQGGSYFIGTGSTLDFGFRMQGVKGVCSSDKVRLTISNGVTEKDYTISVSSDDSGVFKPTAPVVLTGLPISDTGTNYSVFIKGASHLRKKLGDLVIQPGENQAPASWNSAEMKAGDFDEVTSSGFNILDVLDIGKILSVYTALEIPVNSANRIYNVDCNNVINIFDVALVLTNYTALQVLGD